MTRLLATLTVLVAAPRAGLAQPAAPALRFVSPTADTYLSGPVTLQLVYEGGASEILDVTIFVDGRQVCVAPGDRLACAWDAGATVNPHALRAVARLKAGGRAITNVRTRELTHAESVAVEIVQINAVVTDGGRFVKGLTRDAFRLLDDREDRPIVSFEPAGAPLELVLALDVSGSMKEALTELQRAARAFLGALRPHDRVTVVAFNDSLFTLAQRDTTLEARLQSLEKLSAGGVTSLYDAILRSVDVLSRQAGRRVLVLFSDGEDRSSTSTLADVERAVNDNDATIFAVGLGRGAQVAALKGTLERLAETTGGRALFAEERDELHEPFAEIVEDLGNQYTLGFEPRRDGQYHTLSLQIPGRGYRIRARRGYTAPSEIASPPRPAQ